MRLSNTEIAFRFGVAVGLTLDALSDSWELGGDLSRLADEMSARGLLDHALDSLSPSARLTIALAISDSRQSRHECPGNRQRRPR